MKRSFLLLEVFIAFALISLFSVSIMQNPTFYFKKERQILKKLEFDRCASCAYLALKYQKEKFLPWKDLPTKKAASSWKRLPDSIALIETYPTFDYVIDYRAWVSYEKEDREKTYRLVHIEIAVNELNKKKFTHVYTYYTLSKMSKELENGRERAF